MACDCPACQRLCQRTGRKCFVPCEQCIATVEYDAIGALTSRTWVLDKAPSLGGISREPNVWWRTQTPPSIYSDDFWHRVAREAAKLNLTKEGQA